MISKIITEHLEKQEERIKELKRENLRLKAKIAGLELLQSINELKEKRDAEQRTA